MTVNDALPAGLSISVAFRADPDAAAQSDAMAASWGDIALQVDSNNLTAFVEHADLSQAVTWYTLPLLEWLAGNWDFLLHEQRTPQPLTERFACESPWLAGAFSTALDHQADAQWYEWWRRHDLFAAREGGMVPHVCIRRWQDRVEVSWRTTGVPGIPADVRFLAGSGGARLPLVESGQRLWRFLNDSVGQIAQRLTVSSDRLVALQRQVAALQHDNGHHRRRLQCLMGLASADETPSAADTLRAEVEASCSTVSAQSLFETESVPSGIPLLPSCLAADLMRTLDARSAVADLLQIARALTPGEPDSAFTDARNHAYEDRDDLPPWMNGYALAEQFLEAMRLDPSEPVDVHHILSTLGVRDAPVALDPKVRGASVWGGGVRPTALTNSSVEPYPGHPMRRFALAHELCHLLDGGTGRHLGIASTSWAPVETERRANAFAAYLLMPPPAVRRHWSGKGQPIPDAIRRIARRFEVSFTAMAHHLANLDLIDEVERDHALEVVTSAPAPRGAPWTPGEQPRPQRR